MLSVGVGSWFERQRGVTENVPAVSGSEPSEGGMDGRRTGPAQQLCRNVEALMLDGGKGLQRKAFEKETGPGRETEWSAGQWVWRASDHSKVSEYCCTDPGSLLAPFLSSYV